jgi:hypothetical protein
MKDGRVEQVMLHVKRAINFLFVNNPKGTSLGILLGVCLRAVWMAFEPSLKRLPWINAAALNEFVWVCFGVLLFNLRGAFRSTSLPPDLEAALAAIRTAVSEGELTKAQVRTMYLSLYGQVLQRVTLEPRMSSKLKGLQKALQDPIDPAG